MRSLFRLTQVHQVLNDMKSQYNLFASFFFAAAPVLIIKGFMSSDITDNFAAFILLLAFAFELAVFIDEKLN